MSGGTCVSYKLAGDVLAAYQSVGHTVSSNILGNLPLGVPNRDKHDSLGKR